MKQAHDPRLAKANMKPATIGFYERMLDWFVEREALPSRCDCCGCWNCAPGCIYGGPP